MNSVTYQESSIFQRKSSRLHHPEKIIPKSLILELLKAAQWAPSSSNKQPWRYIIFDKSDPEQFKKGLELLYDGNKKWAKNASLLILAVAEAEDEEGKFIPISLHDLGLANENILIRATEAGLVTRPMGGFDKAKTKQFLELPNSLYPLVMIAVGYPGDKNHVDPSIAERENAPRQRKNLSEIAFFGNLDNPIKE